MGGLVAKITEWLEGRRDAPVHFLGAMVLDQKQTPVTHVEKRHVIDGQQRLTTLQIVLANLRDFCREQNYEDLATKLDGFTINKGMMEDPAVDKFKVWPTQADREQFCPLVAGKRWNWMPATNNADAKVILATASGENAPLVATMPVGPPDGTVVCRERLGGVLRHFHRCAA
jgi:hypothetical protein